MLFFFGVDDDAGELAEGRVAEGLSMSDFLTVKAFEVVAPDRGEGVVVRHESLHDDASRPRGSSGAAGNLGQELESAFCGPEVREMQADIRGDDADHLDAGEIVSLGDHLCADHDVDFFVF